MPNAGCGVYGTGYYGIYGTGAQGVYGDGTVWGVSGTSQAGNGIQGVSYSSSANTYGVAGYSYTGGSYTAGVQGTGKNIGVWGACTDNNGGAGIYGSGGFYAGKFEGNILVSGFVYGGAKPFKIDHPLDTANKYLHHISVESPDMTNLYNGLAVLDAKGEAIVTLPAWFETLNRDFRYQLTPLGKASPNLFIAEKVANNSFKIGGGQPGLEVSWQLTGIRQDKWAKAHPLPVELEKSEEEKGFYLHPILYGESEDKRIGPNPGPASTHPTTPPTPPKPSGHYKS